MKLLLTGAFRWSQEQLHTLESQGWEIVFTEREDSELPRDAYDVDAAVCNWLFVNHDMREFRNLKCVQLLSAGLDRVPLDYIREQGIALHNARGVYSVPMAEFAIGGVLQLYKASRFFFDNQRQRVWDKHRGLRELFGKRVLVVGTGSVGCETAKRFGAFTDAVYGVDLYPGESAYFQKIFPLDQLDEQLACSDVVILTLPLTEETRNLFDARRLGKMKAGAVLVNIARGGIVDETALRDALDGQLFGAVVDVFAAEPLREDSPLWEKENLILSPHNSFVSENNNGRMWNVIHSNLTNFLNSKVK